MRQEEQKKADNSKAFKGRRYPNEKLKTPKTPTVLFWCLPTLNQFEVVHGGLILLFFYMPCHLGVLVKSHAKFYQHVQHACVFCEEFDKLGGTRLVCS